MPRRRRKPTHPTAKQILRFLDSETARENRGIARHLLVCASCRSLALQALDPGGPEAGPTGRGLPRLAKVLDYPFSAGDGELVTAGVKARLRTAVGEVESSVAVLDELRGQPAERWPLLVGNCQRFRSLPVVQLLLDECAARFRDAPRLAAELAETALGLIGGLDAAAYGDRLLADIEGRAWAHLANARRQVDDHRGAETAFDRAWELLADSSDPIQLGTYFNFLASLRRDQRRFDEARPLLRTAIRQFEEINDQARVVGLLCALGATYSDEGSPGEALPLLLEAHDRIDEADGPATVMAIRHNLAVCLAELGEYAEARRVFERCRDAYAAAGPHARVRGRWLEGLIAAGLGDEEAAEERFREVRSAFEADELAYDAAVVSLDLAMLLARQGRGAELRQLALAMTGTFLALDIHREAAAALAFFHRAVEQERASAELVSAVSRYLKRARFHPEQSFPGDG